MKIDFKMRILFFSASLLMSAWIISMPASAQQTNSEQTPTDVEFKNMADERQPIDTDTVRNRTSVAEEYDDNKDECRVVSYEECDVAEAADDGAADKNKTTKESGIFVYILSIAAIAVGVVSYLQNKKQADGNNKKIKVLIKENEQLKKDMVLCKTMADSLSEVKIDMASLKRITEELNISITKTKHRNNPQQTATPIPDVNLTKAGTVSDHSPNNVKQEPQKSNVITRYVSNMTINNDGSLSLPIRTLYPSNNGELFMVSWDTETGEGIYSLNPRADDLVAHISKLQQYADGLTSYKGNAISVAKPGRLILEGTTLNVKEKLQLKCD